MEDFLSESLRVGFADGDSVGEILVLDVPEAIPNSQVCATERVRPLPSPHHQVEWLGTGAEPILPLVLVGLRLPRITDVYSAAVRHDLVEEIFLDAWHCPDLPVWERDDLAFALQQ